ncbi:MAG TPA: thiamine phosphate synthase [Nostocaceae cyanobacterium]|nr:thiamine phosphate synthase [Nostocaceae cyanobacterium]
MKQVGCYDQNTNNQNTHNGVVEMSTAHSQTQPTQQIVYRILDANLDRVREGLRIIEEWCRFGLNNAQLAGDCKKLRQETGSWHSAEIRAARDTAGDIGTELTHPQEEERTNITSVLQANFCRVQEALRVIEEYGKLYDANMGKAFKQMRYQVYTLESNLLRYQRQQLLWRSHLYLVTSPEDNILETVEAALKGGLTLVQYREKTGDDLDRLETARKLCELCHKYDALFIVNDRPDIALAVNADGVHVGQKDLPLSLVRQLLGPQKIVGRSTTNPQELEGALAEGADYIGVGPVYATPTKPDKAPAGLGYVSYVAKNCSIPWFAIGGIDANTISDVMNAGAKRVCVVRAIMKAEQPTLVTQYFLSQLHRV